MLAGDDVRPPFWYREKEIVPKCVQVLRIIVSGRFAPVRCAFALHPVAVTIAS